MAQSILLGSDTYLDASGVDGIKAILTSGDLNDYYGIHKSGAYYLNGSTSAFSNCPQGYSTLLVYSGTSGGGQQMIVHRSGIWYRDRSGNPASWSIWKNTNGGRVTGTASNISFGSSGYATLTTVQAAGVPDGASVTGFGIRGWGGASDTPISLALSSDGNTLYAMGVKNATVNTISYFISYAWV